MSDQAVKQKIQSAIQSFNNGSLTENALAFFSTLGYRTDRQSPFDRKSYQYFKDSFLDGNTSFKKEKALVEDWKSIDLLFQLTQEEVSTQQSLFDAKRVDNTIIETYLFFVIELINNDYSRTALSNITRELNKVFPMPVMILFKHGPALTLSIINLLKIMNLNIG
jgi:adenine-specific DNA-methyltransferase